MKCCWRELSRKAKKQFPIIFPGKKEIISLREAGPNPIHILANQRDTATAIKNRKEVPASIMLNPATVIKKVISHIADTPENARSRICCASKIS